MTYDDLYRIGWAAHAPQTPRKRACTVISADESESSHCNAHSSVPTRYIVTFWAKKVIKTKAALRTSPHCITRT